MNPILAPGSASVKSEPEGDSAGATRLDDIAFCARELAAVKARNAAHGSGSGVVVKTEPAGIDDAAARKALGRQKSGLDRVQKHTGGGAAKSAATASSTSSNAPSAASIVGTYKLRCAGIEEEWDDIKIDEMKLRVAPSTHVPGVYIADFNLGVLEGQMLIGTDRAAIRKCARALDRKPRRRYHRGAYQNEEDPWENWKADEPAAAAEGGDGEGKRPFVHTRYLLNWRGYETGEGEVERGDWWGDLKFADAGLTQFKGEMEVGFVSNDVIVRGTKVSDEVPRVNMRDWYKNSGYR
ncbi:hypothetical protein RB594_004725 [Gaeumannomyces avenae]